MIGFPKKLERKIFKGGEHVTDTIHVYGEAQYHISINNGYEEVEAILKPVIKPVVEPVVEPVETVKKPSRTAKKKAVKKSRKKK